MSDDTRVDPPKKRIAVMQSNYIPWKGYFDLMNAVDEFVIYDEVQYTKNDWRNRNKIKTTKQKKTTQGNKKKKKFLTNIF